MNKENAISTIESELEKIFIRSWEELRGLIGTEPYTAIVTGSDGKEYQIEIQCFWDDEPDGDIRVLASIDDGGWRAFLPLTYDRIKLRPENMIEHDVSAVPGR